MGGTWCGWDPGWGSHNKKAPFYCESPIPGPTHTRSHPSVGRESAPHFNMSLWSWVRALTEAKEKGRGLALILL